MPIATVDFEAMYFGEIVEIGAGSWACDDHELVLRFPERFGAEKTGQRRTLSVSRWAAAPSLVPSPRRRVAVQLTDAAREAILHEAYWRSGADGLETGGWLIGGGLSGNRIAIVEATGPGRTATRGENSFTNDLHSLEMHDLKRLWGDPLSARCGSFHTHPGGGTEPSDTDLESWRSGLHVANLNSFQPYYAGIIAAQEARGGWGLHAWVALKRNRETVVEPDELTTIEADYGSLSRAA